MTHWTGAGRRCPDRSARRFAGSSSLCRSSGRSRAPPPAPARRRRRASRAAPSRIRAAPTRCARSTCAGTPPPLLEAAGRYALRAPQRIAASVGQGVGPARSRHQRRHVRPRLQACRPLRRKWPRAGARQHQVRPGQLPHEAERHLLRRRRQGRSARDRRLPQAAAAARYRHAVRPDAGDQRPPPPEDLGPGHLAQGPQRGRGARSVHRRVRDLERHR